MDSEGFRYRPEKNHRAGGGRLISTESLTFNMQNISDLRRRNLRGKGETWYRHRMTQPAQKLDNTLASSRPEVAAHVEQSLTHVITLADTDTLDLQPSRAVGQAVLTVLDERLTLATALAGPANRITAILNGQRGITGDTINDKVVAQ
jgi:hypothetical protein